MKQFYSSIFTVIFALLLGVGSSWAQAPQAVIKRSENNPLPSLKAAAAEARAQGPKFEDLLYLVPNKPLSGGTRTQVGAGKVAGTAAFQSTQGSSTTNLLGSFPGASNDDNFEAVGFRVAPPDTDADRFEIVVVASSRKAAQKIRGTTTLG